MKVRLLRMPGVFHPHSDSWMLVDRLRHEDLHERSSVLDLCAGSGVLAIAAARRAPSGVVAVDRSPRAVLAVRINAMLNGVAVRALRGNLFDPVRGEGFDLIVSNPPYLPGPVDQLPEHGRARAWEAGSDGRAFIDRICAQAPAHLKPGGALLLVHSSVCGEAQTLTALAQNGLEAAVVRRQRGPLGRRLRSRADWLRERGLLTPDGGEEMLVIKAQAQRQGRAGIAQAPT